MDSPLGKTGEVPPTAQHEWDATGWVPEKPPVCDYGYVARGNAVGCSREELIHTLLSRGPFEIKFVWTPDTPQPVFPEKVPLLLETFKKLAVRQAWKAIGLGLGLIAFGVLVALIAEDWSLLYFNIFSVFGAVALVEGIWQYWRSRRYSLADAEADASGFRFDSWVKNKRISGYTFGLGASIVIVGAVQVLAIDENSIELAGLVKPLVWQGEVWRIFTCCLMHASFMHFWLNLLVLLHFARTIESLVGRWCVPIIFLVSSACGSVFSLFLYPNSTSVGASGGIMGLVGFITVAAYFNKTRFPPKYVRRTIEAIIFVALFGLFGFAFIDNAAHLGGLCGGLALAWLFKARSPNSLSEKLKARSSMLSIAALVLLGVISAIAALKILEYW